MKIKLGSPDLLKNAVSIISEIIDEGVFSFTSNGLSLLSPDRTMVAVVDFKLLPQVFEEYDVPTPIDVGLNLTNLAAILKRVKSSDKLTINLDTKNKVELIVEGEGKRRFELPVISVNVERPPIDQLAFSNRIDLECSVMEAGVEDAGIIADSLILEASAEGFKLSAKTDTTSSQLELKKGENGLLEIQAKEPIRARYPLDYLKKMSKACKLSNQVTLEFGTDYPLRLSFKQLDKLNLSFILAPRVED
ncbi:MAG TPA: proliferating cell nuclear antigen (pcna) [archaeon]|nr:proliferating cell nuclear antigen (pcna) [archaeon]